MARLSLGTLLDKLEPRLLPPPGCPSCRGWTEVLLIGDDGPHRPEVCTGCGRAVPATPVRVYVGVRIGRV